MPIDLTITLRTRIYHHRRAEETLETEKSIRGETWTEWQRRWETSNQGTHTRRIWPDVQARTKAIRLINIDFYLSQAYTGHGRFNAKLQSMGITRDRIYYMCHMAEDTPEHALWDCDSGRRHQHILGSTITKENAIAMLMDPTCSGTIQRYLQAVLRTRETTGRYGAGAELSMREEED